MAVSSSSYDWPEFHQNARLDGDAAHSTLSTSNASALGVRWATDLYAVALDSPVVAFNRGLGETLAYVGTEAGNVLAINVVTGQIVWGQWLGSQVRGTPIVYNGSLYVATDSTPAVYELNTTTGAIGCHLVAPMPIESTPIVVSPPGGVPTLYVGSNDATSISGPVLAMNARNCSLEWKFTAYNQTAGSWTAISYAVDAHGEPLIVFGTADPDSTVYALDAVTGVEVWRYQTYNPGQYDVGAGAAISLPGTNGFADGIVYVPNKYGIMYALDLTTGAPVWSTNFNLIAGATEGARSTPALNGRNLVFGYNGGIFDLNPFPGAVIWRYSDATGTEVLSSPALVGSSVGGVVVAGDVSGHVDVLNFATGALLYQYKTGGYIAGSPAVSNGNLLIDSSDGFLYDFAVGGGNAASPPTTAVTSPTEGSTLANPSGNLTVQGSATDPVGVANVQVAIQSGGLSGPWWDGVLGRWVAGPYANPASLVSPGGTSTPWTMAYPVPSPGGVYRLTAFAVSASGRSDIKGAIVDYTVLASTKGPHIKASPAFIAPGASVTVTGAGFAASETVDFSLNGVVLATATASGSGSVPNTKVAIPTLSAFGLNAINASGLTSRKSASAAITIANSWDQSGYQSGQTNYAPNDPVLDHHVYVGHNTWLYLAWHFDAAVSLNASPAVVNGVAYVEDTSGELFALDVQNGGLLWTWTLASHAPLRGSPAVDSAKQLVFVGAGDGSLDAISTIHGSLVWSASVGASLSAPVFGAGEVYVSSASGTVDAFAESSGVLSWSTSLASSLAAPPSLDTVQHRLVVGEANGDVVELNSTTGTFLWSFTTGGPVNAAATLSGGVVYIGSGDGSVYALTESLGAVLWSYATGAPIRAAGALLTQGTPNGRPEYAVGSGNGNFYLLRVATGLLNFQVNGTSSIVGVGAVKGVVVFETSAGDANATRGYTDLSLWTFRTAEPLVTAPVIVDGTVYIASTDGNLYAFTTFGQPPD